MSNHYFGNFENPYAAALNQYVDAFSSPQFTNVYCETPVVERWEDHQINPMTGKPGASAPDLVKRIDDGMGSTGISLWSFPSNKNSDLHFLAQLPHAWAEGTAINIHIHWGTPTNEPGTVVHWQFEYDLLDIGDTCANSTVLNIAPACPAARTHTLSSFGYIDMTGKKISCIIPCRLSRVPGANEYTQGATLLGIDFHIRLNTIGSATETSK